MEDLGEDFNSVYNHGSKKQNLNHLLNFHKYTKESDGYSGAFSKHGYQHYLNRSKRYNYNKEQYLQANCKFVVKEDDKFNYQPFKASPDTLVEWDQVIKVLISSCEESQCPICLYPPKAAKMTKCGHIYCFSCMLHYLSLSDKPWRKCPICYENIQLKDLKSSSSKHIHQSYKVGDIINLELMKREKGSLFVNKADVSADKMINDFPNFANINEQESFIYSKLIMANKHEMLKIVESELNELDFQLAEDGYDCPESIFVQQAMDILNAKREGLEKSNVIDEKLPVSLLEVPIVAHLEAPESVCSSTHEHEDEDDLIDEDCELTIDDIDIIPVSSNVKQFFYYQALNGQNIFLHSVNSKMLQLMFGSLELSPQNIRGRIVQIKNCSMNEDLRKRLKYLQHLPVSSVFEIVEIEFEHGTISKDVYDIFKDDLLQRRKFRQRREREENKREKAIDEINDRQMGKMMKSSANIDLGSTSQFPEYDSHDMPALASNVSDRSTSPVAKVASSGPSYSTMLAKPIAKKSVNLWPSLACNKTPATSFFGDKNLITVNKPAIPATAEENKKSDIESDGEECKAPVYKNNFSDALANALKSASLNENSPAGKSASSGKKSKKKAKKTLLFSSGMNFN